MIKNSLSSSAYELDIIKQDIPRLESVLTEKRRIELFKIIKNSEIKSKPKENTVDDNSQKKIEIILGKFKVIQINKYYNLLYQ